MQRRIASINDLPIAAKERRYRWLLVRVQTIIHP
jgi:nuclear transport factor 2 (NTF2) superfamily protein